jgi:hypothetical protein
MHGFGPTYRHGPNGWAVTLPIAMCLGLVASGGFADITRAANNVQSCIQVAENNASRFGMQSTATDGSGQCGPMILAARCGSTLVQLAAHDCSQPACWAGTVACDVRVGHNGCVSWSCCPQ